MPRAVDTVQRFTAGWQPISIFYVPSRKAWAVECDRRNMETRTRPWPFDTSSKAGRVEVLMNARTRATTAIAVFINIDLFRDFSEIVEICVHESAHVWQFVCDEIGENAPGKELEAYALQSITVDLINAIVRCHPRVKKLKWRM